jgi:(5-formylfuran-3-yl)methyl phosphate synthase
MMRALISHKHTHAPLMLASVMSVAEAELAIAGGADVMDIKDARAGALGAASLETSALIIKAMHALKPTAPISATVGDLPMEPSTLRTACVERAALGVDYVKVGLMPGEARAACIAALSSLVLPQSTRLVAVLFADIEAPSDALLKTLSSAGFAGVVIDTFDKTHGNLLAHAASWPQGETLHSAVEAAREHGLFTGLAGGLGLNDIETLHQAGAAILGFRGALCAGSQRVASLQLACVKQVRHHMHKASSALTTLQLA